MLGRTIFCFARESHCRWSYFAKCFGSTEQQELGEISKDITKLFLKQGYDIEITINSILEELKKFEIPEPKKTWRPFLKNKFIPQSSLIGQFNATSYYIEKLKTD